MSPPCVLALFRFILFLLCFPLGKLPLSFLALEKCLYLREQDTGQGFRFMEGNSRALVKACVNRPAAVHYLPKLAVLAVRLLSLFTWGLYPKYCVFSCQWEGDPLIY